MSAEHLWDSKPSQIRFSYKGNYHNAVELVLRAPHKMSLPNLKIIIYELSDGIHIMTADMKASTVIPKGVKGVKGTEKNFAFVEALVNRDLSSLEWDKAKQAAARLVRKGLVSAETQEVFAVHVSNSTGLLATTRRRLQVETMKATIKQLGDLTEEEMLDIWREARTEEVMDA